MPKDGVVLNWLKLVWPIIAFTVVMALAGVSKFYDNDKRIAVIENDYTHLQAKIDDMASDVKEVKSILMNPVR